ncbi:hypothetical protein [Halorubrum halodurans]|uniref:Uncharacterized protein n=1 Tax=Halorubrum halodurans TaxID=1383851 RepID=A0A256IEK4_9EURY|nr:hypothetical protein [Halorubrum halodurans]OYR54988.1 hypothetical protein DJ70_12690 [Halorubrum halodurans]
MLDSPKAGERQVTALVEIAETVVGTPTPTTFEDVSEGVETFFCGEPKADDEPCEREVDDPDDICWQH